MERTKYLYAAIGAPVVIAKQARHRLDDLRSQLGERTSKLTDEARRQIDAWATEGEDVFGKLSESETIDELASKMDLDQVQEQVSKLREHLEDLLATWRSNFRPETPAKKAPAEESAVTTPEPKPAAKKPAAKAPAAKKPAAKKPAAKKPAAKKPAAKPAAKKPAEKPTEETPAKAS